MGSCQNPQKQTFQAEFEHFGNQLQTRASCTKLNIEDQDISIWHEEKLHVPNSQQSSVPLSCHLLSMRYKVDDTQTIHGSNRFLNSQADRSQILKGLDSLSDICRSTQPMEKLGTFKIDEEDNEQIPDLEYYKKNTSKQRYLYVTAESIAQPRVISKFS